MKFMPLIQVASDPKEIRFSVFDYDLEPEAFFNGTWFYKRVPLPTGSLKIVFNTTLYCRPYVIDAIKGELLSAILSAMITATTICWIETKLRGIVEQAHALGDLSLHDETLGYVIEGEPEYFQ